MLILSKDKLRYIIDLAKRDNAQQEKLLSETDASGILRLLHMRIEGNEKLIRDLQSVIDTDAKRIAIK